MFFFKLGILEHALIPLFQADNVLVLNWVFQNMLLFHYLKLMMLLF